MTKRSIIILLGALIATSTLATYSYLPDYLSKKMRHHLTKVFGKNISYEEVSMNDGVSVNNQVFLIKDTDSISGYSIITRALGCKLGGCDKPPKDSIAFEHFYFLTAFDKNKRIKKVRVLEYTGDHGYQVANKGWLKQFEDDKHFEVGKNIDGISGATVSVKSITSSINLQVDIIEKYF